MHVFFATPVRDSVAHEMVAALDAARAICHANGIKTTAVREPRGGVVLARNLLARTAADHDADVLFFVDADVAGFSPDDVLRVLTAGEDVVGAPLPGRSLHAERIARALAAGAPLDALLWRHASPLLMHERAGGGATLKNGHLLEVDGLGTGFLAISRRALDRVARELPPCFFEDVEIRNVFDFAIDAREQLMGEDFAFCMRWRALGGRIWADTRASIQHIGRFAFQAIPLGERLVARADGEARSELGNAPDKRPRFSVELIDFECPPELVADALDVAGGAYDCPVSFGRPPIVLDVGANVGAFARWARAKWPGAGVVAYEPHPVIAAICARNLRGQPSCRVDPRAVSDRDGRATLHVGRVACQSTLYSDVAEVQGSGETLDVDQIDAATLPDCDVLKIDTEGAELAIARAYLGDPARTTPALVLVEYHRAGDRRALEDVLGARGLEVIKGEIYGPNGGVLWFGRSARSAPATEPADPPTRTTTRTEASREAAPRSEA